MSGTTVYAVASGKGGVGKTTTTVNLGTALAGAGRRVAIVDADLGMANLAGFVSLSPDGPTLHDVLADEADASEATYEVADGIAAVPSGTELDEFATADATGLADAVDDLRGEFDYVLLDVGAGVSHESVLPLGVADEVVLVSTPEPASVQDVRKTIDLVDRSGGDVAGLVVTRGRPDGGVSHDEIASRLGVDLLGSIPEDPTVRDSVYAGTPLVVHEPESSAATAYRKLAATLADGVEPDAVADDDAEATEDSEADRTGDDAPENSGEPATESSVEDAIAGVDDEGDADDAQDADDDTGASDAERAESAVVTQAESDGAADAASESEPEDGGATDDAAPIESDDDAVTIPDAESDTDDGESEDEIDLDDDAIPFSGDDATDGDAEDDIDTADSEDQGDDEADEEEQSGGFLGGIF
ncbi:septum site-determining protein MinD [Natronoarchaeum philippinense]|uniref:Septum site-determining protein MinD n=1 Tax=Natronoarchaeum philippinense TaxID=558529 RepID=A0A285PC60_NATPI|nr:cell division ATPase MinD [Natronoarchaeum philippinense]SNZ17441.1 septum site-determining protein MinD [Natronoarchaeum philippinense]